MKSVFLLFFRENGEKMHTHSLGVLCLRGNGIGLHTHRDSFGLFFVFFFSKIGILAKNISTFNSDDM